MRHSAIPKSRVSNPSLVCFFNARDKSMYNKVFSDYSKTHCFPYCLRAILKSPVEMTNSVYLDKKCLATG